MEENKYNITYQLGKSTVHIVAPTPMTEEEKEKILFDFYTAGWAIWNSLPKEERVKINQLHCQKKPDE